MKVLHFMQEKAVGSRIRVRLSVATAVTRCAISVAAVMASGRLAAGQQPDAVAYGLEPGDRVALAVYGQPDMSGDLVVDGAGSIDVPFVGPIVVLGLSIEECRKLIAGRLSQGILAQPSVSVRLSEARPLYVLGDVRSPGAFPFRFGLTVRAVLALAGGVGPAAEMQYSASADLLLAEERLRQSVGLQRALIIRQSRIDAQRRGAESFEPPAFGDQAAFFGDTPENIGRLVAAEQLIFSSQAASLQDQVDLLQSQKVRIKAETDAMDGQIESEKKQLALVREQIEQYDQLTKKGLGRFDMAFEFKLGEARHQSDLWRLLGEKSRLQLASGDLDIKLNEVKAAFEKQVIVELQDTQQKLRDLEVTIPSVRSLVDVRRRQVGQLFGPAVERTITISRSKGNEVVTFAATENQRLEPGDIVEAKVSPSLDGSAAVKIGESSLSKGIGPVETRALASAQGVRE